MGFNSYHPTINLIFFATAIGFAICFDHPIYIAISFIFAFAYSVKLNGIRALVFNLCLVPLVFVWAAWYSYYTHFGVTNLRTNFAGNYITLESIVYGFAIGMIAASVIMWMSCVFAVFSSDKLVYLFGRVSPRLSLFLSIILRGIPKIKRMARKINTAQRGVGRGCEQGGIFARFMNCVRLFSMMITWTMESFIQSSESMKSRGYTLKGRTAFSIYRFDNRDRSLVLVIFACLTVMMMAIMLGQVTILYNPEIIIDRITRLSCVFYLVYGLYLLLPMALQIVSEIVFERCKMSCSGEAISE